jgi:hypothetical protein
VFGAMGGSSGVGGHGGGGDYIANITPTGNVATSGAVNTGSGGGGGGHFMGYTDGADGAAGIVMIRYQVYGNGRPV